MKALSYRGYRFSPVIIQRSAGLAQRFLSSYSASYNTFNVCRHRTTASTHRILRSQAFDAWKTAVAVPTSSAGQPWPTNVTNPVALLENVG